MSYLAGLLTSAVQSLYQFTGSYGLAIIIVSVILRILIAPTQHYQIISGRRLKEVEPHRKALEKRYKGDPKRLQEETSRLYKEHKVNPMASCLPLLLQIPIIWAFFTALRTFEYLGPSNFLWIADLSQPDLWILPLIAGASTYLQSKLTMPPSQGDSTSQMMQIMMPLLIIWFSRSFAAGLALYWVVSNIVSILQQLIFPAGGRKKATPGEAAS